MKKPQFTVNEQDLIVTIQSVLDAPRERVWQAHTDATMVAKWWGPRGYKMKVETYEPKVGGKWRILHVDPEGREHWFHGEYKTVIEPEKIERTFIYEPVPDAVMQETTTFDVLDENRTEITTISQFPTLEALRGMTSTGMEWGATQSIERLAEIVELR